MIKAIFFDIDGTLFSHRFWRIPPSALDALHTLKEKGIRLFIASGRPTNLLDMTYEHLEHFPFDGYVLFNGQFCADADCRPFFEQPLPVEALRALIPWLAQREDIVCTFNEMGYAYHNRPQHSFDNPVDHPGVKLPETKVEDPVRSLTHDTYQLNPYIPPEMDAEFLAHAPGLKAVRWSERFCDVIPADGGKPRGMRVMLDRFGIRMEESMAFGDGGNDIEMLCCAGIGIAMGNAMQEVKDAANYVTTDIDDDGVVNALRHFGLL